MSNITHQHQLHATSAPSACNITLQHHLHITSSSCTICIQHQVPAPSVFPITPQRHLEVRPRFRPPAFLLFSDPCFSYILTFLTSLLSLNRGFFHILAWHGEALTRPQTLVSTVPSSQATCGVQHVCPGRCTPAAFMLIACHVQHGQCQSNVVLSVRCMT